MAEMMATAMVEKGHEVEVVTLRTGPTPSDERIAVPGAPARGSGPATYRVRRLEFLPTPIRLPVGYWRVLQEPTDVLHVFGNRIWNSDFFLPIARRLPYPKVLTGQNFYQLHMHPNFVNSLYARRYFPRMAEGVQCYVVQTVQELEQIRAFGYRGRVERIPHTVDVEEFPVDPSAGAAFRQRHGLEGKLLLFSAGGYMPNKRMDRVLEAVAACQTPWQVVITGNDWPGHSADLAHCRRIAMDRGVAATFLGDGAPVPRAEVIGAFQGCDVYAQGSSYEGYGGAVQEAMTVEKPFVAFETGAMSEFAAAGAGYSVRSVREMAEALDRLAGSEPERRRMGQAGRVDVVKHRSRVVTMNAYDRLFRELVEGGNASPLAA
jgi:glycosyltransferase involved in cell wall biosynthesis